MLVEVEIYSLGTWIQTVAIDEKPTPTKGWIETDSIRRITVLRKELIEWVERIEITSSPIDVSWLDRIHAYITSQRISEYRETKKTVREPKGTGEAFDYWEIVYFDGNEICIVPKGELIIFSINQANKTG